ncbi:hypothetical protein Hanom_Chr01g00041421 [Helianthus anomalus]
MNLTSLDYFLHLYTTIYAIPKALLQSSNCTTINIKLQNDPAERVPSRPLLLVTRRCFCESSPREPMKTASRCYK